MIEQLNLQNSIAFIGDVHLQYSNPSSRIDEYFKNVLIKWRSILSKNKYAIGLGDLFSNPVLDIEGLMAVIQVLTSYKNAGGIYYELVGNHPVYNWSVATLGKTTLGLLAKLDLVHIIDSSGEIDKSMFPKSKIQIEDWTIRTLNLRDPRNTIPTPKNDKEILVAHAYYEFNKDPKHSLYYDDLRDTKFRYIFLGHDHQFYKPKLIESGATLFRPGSLGREAAHSYNFTRELGYYRLNLDTEKVEWVPIDYLPANEIFSYEVVEKHNDTTPKYVYDLDELMKSFKNKSKVKVSIRKMMEDNPEIPDEIVDFIDEVHQLCDLPFV